MLLALAILPARAQSAGDIAIVGFRSDDPDEFAFVALAPIAGGTEIAFTDNGWQAAGGFRANEGVYRYTVPATGLATGTVVTVTSPTGPLFSSSGDQLLAYVGTDSSPTFLYALNVEGDAVWQDDAQSSNTSALPAGLVNGATAVAVAELDNVAYTGLTSGTRSELLAAISTASNWTGSDTDRPAFPTAFTVTGSGGNLAPAFTAALTSASAYVGLPFTFDYDATDPEGDALTFALVASPTGTTLDAQTGVLRWSPPPSSAGQTVTFTVSVSDGTSMVTTSGTAAVFASVPNQAPAFDAPTYSVLVDGSAAVSIDYDATDTEGDLITYALTTAPSGTTATLDATTGVFSWTAPDAPGIYPFVVTATDASGAASTIDLFVGVRGTLFPDLRLSALRTALRGTYSGRTLGYDRGRDTLYAKVEAYPDGVVSGIYTGFAVTLPPNQDPSTYLANAGINAEHTWPQSMGADSEPQRSDMHMLYPSKSNVNSSRGNSPFGEVPDAQTQTWFRGNQSQTTIPTLEIDEWSERGSTYFEPRERVKGDIARALLYFATMYESAASPSFLTTERPVMLSWNELDPASAGEVLRSGLIKRYQGNVNPFVLDPTLARRAFDETYATADEAHGSESGLLVAVYPNPTAGQTTVSIQLAAPARVSIEAFDILGRQVATSGASLAAGSADLVLDLSSLPTGPYAVRVTTGSETVVHRVTVVR